MNALERNRRNKQATIKLHQQIKLTKTLKNSCITENHSFIGYMKCENKMFSCCLQCFCYNDK